MSAIEQRARELLAAEMDRSGRKGTANKIRQGRPAMFREELRAIIAALAPPEGFVLVPVYPTEAMLDAEHATAEIHNEWGEGLYVENAEAVWAAMLAARPEAK